MALFDARMFDPSSYTGGMNGGLLGYLAQALREKSGAAPEDQPTPVVGGAGNYPVPTFGQPPQINIPPAAQPTQYQPPSQIPPLPSAAIGGPGGNLMAGFQGFTNSGSPMQALGNLVGGLVTGQRTDPQGIALAQMNATYQALVPKLGPQAAAVLAMNPAALGELLKPNVLPPGGQLAAGLTLNGGQSGQPADTGSSNILAKNDTGLLPDDVARGLAIRYVNGDRNVFKDSRFYGPLGQMNMTKVLTLAQQQTNNPMDISINQAKWEAKPAMAKDAAVGTIGKSNNALNTGIQHLSQLSDTIANLGNGQFTPSNYAKNVLGPLIGATGPTNFNAVAQRVAPEITRIWRGAGGAEQDIERDLKTLSNANTPEQLYGAIGNIAGLMEGKISANQQQYENVYGQGSAKFMIPQENLDALTRIKSRGLENASVAQPTATGPHGEKITLDPKTNQWVPVKAK